MALKKDIPHATGATANYWMIEEMTVQKKIRHAHFVLAGYTSRAARDDAPLDGVLTRKRVALNGEDFDRFYKDVVVDKTKRTYEAAYDYIKQQDKFAGATDILE
jgi:predicted outer membrane protein